MKVVGFAEFVVICLGCLGCSMDVLLSVYRAFGYFFAQMEGCQLSLVVGLLCVGMLTHSANVPELHVPWDVFTFLRCWFAVSVGGGYRGFAQFF